MKRISCIIHIILLAIIFVLSSMLFNARHEIENVQHELQSMRKFLTPYPQILQAPNTSPTEPATKPSPQEKEASYFSPPGLLPFEPIRHYAMYYAFAQRHTLREDNPIDAAFCEYWGRSKSTLEENVMASHYQECWETEMLHAFDLLAIQANPNVDYIITHLEETKESLLAFALSNGELYADITRTDAYLTEGTSHGEKVAAGTAYSGALSMAMASIYRAYTFYLYDMLTFLDISPDFIFNREDMEKEWEYLFE